MRKIITGFVFTVAAFGLAGVVATGAAQVTSAGALSGPVVDDGNGTSLAQTQRLSARDGDILLTTTQQICRTGFYADGAVHARPCNTRDYDGGFWWRSLYRLVWNVPVSQGGHSDIFMPECWHVGGATECGTSFVLDGETEDQGTDRQAGADTTAWVEVDNAAGGYSPATCLRYFFSSTGGTAIAVC